MDTYHMWCNLKPGMKDLAFSDAVKAYLDYLQGRGVIQGWRLTRRKLGFGPDTLGEFHIAIEVRDLPQLEEAFQHVATRDGEVERVHHAVYSAVTDFKAALYRDFPDPVRKRS